MLSVGDIIRMKRLERKISQEELAIGICSVSNLSRIETGEQIPSRATYNAFMERMGLSPEVFPSFLNSRELTAFQLVYDLKSYINNGDYTMVEKTIAKLEKGHKLENIYRQQILFAKALISRRKGAPPDEVLASMKQAVEMSVKGFGPKEILRYVLSRDELNMINNLAIAYADAGDIDSAIDMLYGVKEYVEKKVSDRYGVSVMYTTAIYNLSKYLGLMGRYEEGVKLCEDGLGAESSYTNNKNMAGLFYNKGYGLVMMGQKDEARECIQNAYYIYKAMGLQNYCGMVRQFAAESDIVI